MSDDETEEKSRSLGAAAAAFTGAAAIIKAVDERHEAHRRDMIQRIDQLAKSVALLMTVDKQLMGVIVEQRKALARLLEATFDVDGDEVAAAVEGLKH